MTFTGDVYGFAENVAALEKKGYTFQNRRSSAEFMLHSFEEFGRGFLKDLNGTFACAVDNRSTGELMLANDTFGIYPLFVYETDHHCLFCTEYEPITRHGNISQDLDYDAIAEFFTLGLPLGDKTFFKNISNLQRGSILKISPDPRLNVSGTLCCRVFLIL